MTHDRAIQRGIQRKKEVAAKRFEWSVRGLAQPPRVQILLFPDFADKADGLALEFDEWRRAFFGSGASDNLQPQQMQLVAELDALLASMSGKTNAELWTDEALAQREEWRKVRHVAAELLRAMRWNDAPPPINRGDKYAEEG